MNWEEIARAVGAVALLFGSGAAVVGGLSGWLGKIWAERIAERERQQLRRDVEIELQRLKDQIDRGQFVHRLQFETEFKAYVELWDKAIEVRQAALSLRPEIDFEPHLEPLDEKQKRFARFSEAYNEFTKHFTKAKPFLSEKVFTAANRLRQITFIESRAYVRISPPTEQQLQDADKNADEIIEKADLLCAAIRERIWFDDNTPMTTVKIKTEKA